jgi:hypothetical protein
VPTSEWPGSGSESGPVGDALDGQRVTLERTDQRALVQAEAVRGHECLEGQRNSGLYGGRAECRKHRAVEQPR